MSTSRTDKKGARQQRLVLLIEDNEDHARLFASVLATQTTAAKIHAVQSIEEGLESLRRLPCSMIVVDAFLRNRSTLHRLPLLRRQAPGTPILVLAGSGDESLAAEAIKRGATEYVVKNREALEQLPLLLKQYLVPSKHHRAHAFVAFPRRPSPTEAMRQLLRETESLTKLLRASLTKKRPRTSRTALRQQLHHLLTLAAGALKK